MGDAGSRLLVVELAQGVAGPAVGRLFSALGHSVVKVEPTHGDRLRRTAGTAEDIAWASATFAHVNSGKLGVVADADDDPRLTALLDRADLVIDDDRDRMLRLDLIGDGRRRRRERLVTLALSNFGLDDDAPGARPDSLLAESFGGMATMIGEPDRAPLSLGGEQAEYAAAFAGFFGAMASLIGVRRTGSGEVVDVSLSDVVAYMDWKTDVAFAVTGIEQSRVGAQAGRWRILRARDGWVGVVYQPDQWDKVVELIGDARLSDPAFADEAGRDERADAWWPIIENWVAERSEDEVYRSAQAIGLAFGTSVDMRGISSSAQNRVRGFVQGAGADVRLGALFQSEDLGWRAESAPVLGGDGDRVDALLLSFPAATPGRAESVLAAPLAGVTVLDHGTITAGAATGRLLADLGADVIKVESPTRPDSFRYWSFPGEAGDDADTSPVFRSNNSGKVGIALNLKDPTQRDILFALVRNADVLVENFSVGVTARLGIDAETVRRINARLVYLSLSSQGQYGPESANRSYGSTLDLLSGLASITGYADGGPIWSSVDVNYPDQLVSLLGAGVVCAALWHGAGATIDISQREAVTWTLAGYLGAFGATGSVPGPRGNDRPGYLLHDIVACADDVDSVRWIAVSARDTDELGLLVACIGTPTDLPVSERLAEWAASRSRDEALAALRAHGVPAAPVLGAAERSRIEHFRRRRVHLDDPRQKGFPFVLESRKLRDPARAPRLGEHNHLLVGSAPAASRE